MNKLRRLYAAADTGRLATYLIALWKLFKHPETPRAAKWVAIAVLAYAVSPIDLVPDFIPVLGQLDDLVLVPLGIALVVRLTPQAHWKACLADAERTSDRLPRLRAGAVVVVLFWALALGLLLWAFAAWLAGRG